MNVVDYVMAIPFAIAIIILFLGILLIVGYLFYQSTGDKDAIVDLVHKLTRHWISYLVIGLCIGYLIAIFSYL